MVLSFFRWKGICKCYTIIRAHTYCIRTRFICVGFFLTSSCFRIDFFFSSSIMDFPCMPSVLLCSVEKHTCTFLWSSSLKLPLPLSTLDGNA
jgi:hypothetical protein